MTRIYVIAEDTYGCDFLRRVVDRMRREGILRGEPVVSVSISDCHHLGILRNRKVGRVARAALLDRGDDKVLIAVDAMPFVRDGMGGGRVEEMMDRVKLVVFSQEAEEWITASMGRGSTDEKPSEFLRRTRGYEKRELPDYAESLDLGALRRVRSFSDFAGALGDP